MYQKLASALGILPEDAETVKDAAVVIGSMALVFAGAHLAMRIVDKLID